MKRGRLVAKLIVVTLVLFCLGSCPISSCLSLAGGLVRVGSGQSQFQIHSNRGRGLGDCWPLRPCEAAGLGLLIGTLPPAASSPGSSPGKLLRAPCEASPGGGRARWRFFLARGRINEASGSEYLAGENAASPSVFLSIACVDFICAPNKAALLPLLTVVASVRFCSLSRKRAACACLSAAARSRRRWRS